MNLGMYTYEARVLPVSVDTWRTARPGRDFTFERQQPLRTLDTFENEGVAYEVAYVVEVGSTVFALIRRIQRNQNGTNRAHAASRPVNRVTSVKPALIANLGAIHANLPQQDRQLFERQLRRLFELYRPSARL